MHILRLQRNTQDFEEDVFRAEKDLEKQINEQRKKITDLSKETLELTQKNNELLRDSNELEKKILTLEKNLTDITKLNNEMLSSIKTLSTDNEALMNQLKIATKELFECNTRKQLQNVIVNEDIEETQAMAGKKPQVLIIGDENARGLISLFKYLTNKEYDVNCQWSRRLLFDDHIKHCLRMIRRFTKEDCVILFTGVTNALKGKPVISELLLTLLHNSANTNLFICGPPFQNNRPILNKLIQQNDFKLSECIRRFSHSYFIPSRVTSRHGLLTYYEKKRTASINLQYHKK